MARQKYKSRQKIKTIAATREEGQPVSQAQVKKSISGLIIFDLKARVFLFGLLGLYSPCVSRRRLFVVLLLLALLLLLFRFTLLLSVRGRTGPTGLFVVVRWSELVFVMVTGLFAPIKGSIIKLSIMARIWWKDC